ncbi:MAG: nucleotidyltransferase domain-containing protein [bacterium]
MDSRILLEEKIKTYFKNKNEVVAIYLFGSYAKGKQLSASDIDIGILLYRNYRENHKELFNN